MIPREWIFSHRCSWITVYVFYCNAQSEPHSDPRDVCTLSLLYQLPNCNLFTQHVIIYLMERHRWRTMDPGPISFILLYRFIITRSVYFTCILLSFYHSIRSILCSQQTSEIDNLIKVGSKVLGCVVCRFHVATGEKLHADKPLSGVSRS
jgi:hypothetical protein